MLILKCHYLNWKVYSFVTEQIDEFHKTSKANSASHNLKIYLTFINQIDQTFETITSFKFTIIKIN